MIFVGDDWAEDHHDVHLMDDTGARLASRRFPEGLAGIGEFHQLLARHGKEAEQVMIGIKTDRGLWVEALDSADYQVYAINPLAAVPLPRPSPPIRGQVRCRGRQTLSRSGAYRSTQSPPSRR